MQAFIYTSAVVVAYFLVLLGGPAIALALLLLRKKRVGARRRSPIPADALRSPGHSLREEVDALSDSIDESAMTLFVMPIGFVSVGLAIGHIFGQRMMFDQAWVYAVAIVGVIAFFSWRLWSKGNGLDALRAGYDAELIVGQELDQLMRQGAYVFHDVPGNRFNVDHVVISRAGVFAVETKGFTKPVRNRGKDDATVVFNGTALQFPTWTTAEPLEQAQRQASWVAGVINAVMETPIRVRPVVALPGWFVDRRGRGAVGVYNNRELSRLLSDRGSQPLSQRDLERAVHVIEQKCRNVVPTYGRASKPRLAER